jgi:hypothetical protein
MAHLYGNSQILGQVCSARSDLTIEEAVSTASAGANPDDSCLSRNQVFFYVPKGDFMTSLLVFCPACLVT